MAGVALVVLAAGLCLFDHDEDGAAHHGGTGDVCAAVMAIFVVFIFLAHPLAVTGRLPADGARLAYAACRHLPDPPPKPHSLF